MHSMTVRGVGTLTPTHAPARVNLNLCLVQYFVKQFAAHVFFYCSTATWPITSTQHRYLTMHDHLKCMDGNCCSFINPSSLQLAFGIAIAQPGLGPDWQTWIRIRIRFGAQPDFGPGWGRPSPRPGSAPTRPRSTAPFLTCFKRRNLGSCAGSACEIEGLALPHPFPWICRAKTFSPWSAVWKSSFLLLQIISPPFQLWRLRPHFQLWRLRPHFPTQGLYRCAL